MLLNLQALLPCVYPPVGKGLIFQALSKQVLVAGHFNTGHFCILENLQLTTKSQIHRATTEHIVKKLSHMKYGVNYYKYVNKKYKTNFFIIEKKLNVLRH